MSLVETAIKKMQAAQGAAQPAKPTPPVVPAAVTPPAAPAAAPAPAVARTEKQNARIVNIDRNALRSLQLLPPLQQERQLAKEYRHIKRPLIANAFGRGVERVPNGRAIMVASALAGDGKTFTSLNLALSLALEKDISVLLVDADVAKPHISRVLNLAEEPGLLDALRDERADVESMILPTDVPGLSILPAGRPSDTATELLASERMTRVVSEVSAHEPNRIVLFDTPPLLLTSESRAVASVVGQVVLVVRAGGTPQHAVQEAVELLGEGKSIGLVLTQCDDGSAEYYQYYGNREESVS